MLPTTGVHRPAKPPTWPPRKSVDSGKEIRKASQPGLYRKMRCLKLSSFIPAFADRGGPSTRFLLKTIGNVCPGGAQATFELVFKPCPVWEIRPCRGRRFDYMICSLRLTVGFNDLTLFTNSSDSVTLWLSTIWHGSGGNNHLYHLILGTTVDI